MPWIDKNGQFNGRYQHEGHGERSEHHHDDQEDGGKRDVVGHLEIHSGGVDQIVGQYRLTGDERFGVIALYDALQFFQLDGYLVRGSRIFGVDHHHLPAALFQHITQGLRNEKIRNAAAQHGVIREDRGNAFHILYGGLQ